MGIRDIVLKAKELRLREKELGLRRWEAQYRSKSELTENGFKGLVLINGGAAVALGALLQAIISKPEAAEFVRYLLAGIGFNVAGVAAASFAFYARYKQLGYEAKTGKYTKENPWWRWVWRIALFSVAAFVLSLGIVVFGGFYALQLPEPVKWSPVAPPSPTMTPNAPATPLR